MCDRVDRIRSFAQGARTESALPLHADFVDRRMTLSRSLLDGIGRGRATATVRR